MEIIESLFVVFTLLGAHRMGKDDSLYRKGKELKKKKGLNLRHIETESGLSLPSIVATTVVVSIRNIGHIRY
jgi:hypothetical protein